MLANIVRGTLATADCILSLSPASLEPPNAMAGSRTHTESSPGFLNGPTERPYNRDNQIDYTHNLADDCDELSHDQRLGDPEMPVGSTNRSAIQHHPKHKAQLLRLSDWQSLIPRIASSLEHSA